MAAPKKNLPMKWEEELAKEAEVAAGMEEGTSTGQFFSMKSGVLSFNGSPMANNQMAVIILDSVLENVYYQGEYDPDTPSGPSCFAFGRDEKTMEPHKIVVEAGSQMAPQCHGCECNEWGSADKGKGKACRNTRRLAMISAGTMDANGKFKLEEEDVIAASALAYMKLPVTSVKGYAAFVKQVSGALRRPPFGIATRVTVMADPKTQFKVTFEPIMSLPDEVMAAVMARHKEAMAVIEFPYQLQEGAPPPPPKKAKPKPRKF